MLRFTLHIVLVLLPFTLLAQSPSKGFKALNEYDFFKARTIFKSNIKKNPVLAYYGLSKIAHDSLNHFYQLDSAYFYINISEQAFRPLSPKEKKKLAETYFVTGEVLQQQKEKVIYSAYLSSVRKNTIEGYNHFISYYKENSKTFTAVERRNELAFEIAKMSGTHQALKQFIDLYPDSKQIGQAKQLYESALYLTLTEDNSLGAYVNFIDNYPASPFKSDAERWVYRLSTLNGEPEDYYRFIKKFPFNVFVDSAWKAIYQYYSEDFSPERISEFRRKYPEYPDLDEVLKDFELSRYIYIPFSENNKSGFIDSTGEVKIPFQYEWTSAFNEGLALVQSGEKFGYITKDGTVKIGFEYDEAERFNNGMAIVGKDAKFGVINRKGKTVVPFVFTELYEFKEGLAYAEMDGKAGFINMQGKWQIQPELQSATDFENGISIARQKDKKGLLTHEGNWILPPEMDEITRLNPEYFLVAKNDSFGLVDLKGNWVFKPEYQKIFPPANGLFKAVKGTKTGFMSLNEKESLAFKYEEQNPDVQPGFFKGTYKVKQKGKVGLIGVKGKWIVPREYEDISVLSEDLFFVKKDGKWGLINAQLKSKIPFIFDQVVIVSPQLQWVRKGKERYWLSDLKHKSLVKTEVTEVKPFNKNALWVISSEEKFGLMDANGKVLIPIEFETEFKDEIYFLTAIKEGKPHFFSKTDFRLLFTR